MILYCYICSNCDSFVYFFSCSPSISFPLYCCLLCLENAGESSRARTFWSARLAAVNALKERACLGYLPAKKQQFGTNVNKLLLGNILTLTRCHGKCRVNPARGVRRHLNLAATVQRKGKKREGREVKSHGVQVAGLSCCSPNEALRSHVSVEIVVSFGGVTPRSFANASRDLRNRFCVACFRINC